MKPVHSYTGIQGHACTRLRPVPYYMAGEELRRTLRSLDGLDLLGNSPSPKITDGLIDFTKESSWATVPVSLLTGLRVCG